MRILLSLLVLILSLPSFGQEDYQDKNVSSQIKKIVAELEKVNELMSSAVYYGGIRPKQWDTFEELNKTATTPELIELTRHPNGVVRSYSFWALSLKEDIDLFSIVKEHLADDEPIRIQSGCVGGQEMVGDFFINIMTPRYVDINAKKMTALERAELDSLLIYLPNKLESRNKAIWRVVPTAQLYPRIRELVVKENNQNALVTLAKYQKEQDVELIRNNKVEGEKVANKYFYTYKAICEFPRPEFLILLEAHLKNTLDNTLYSTEWRELYTAIAKYKNATAIRLLKIPFTEVEQQNMRKFHLNFVFSALEKHHDPIYEELYWKLWLEEDRISIPIYQYLLLTNPSKAFELTKKKFNVLYEVKKTAFKPKIKTINFDANHEEVMLDILILNDQKFADKVIAEQIENGDNIPLYTAKVDKQKKFIEPLFKRLEKAWNAHTYLNLVKTLISYKDAKINQRILEVRKRNSNMNENWGAKILDELLLEYNIK